MKAFIYNHTPGPGPLRAYVRSFHILEMPVLGGLAHLVPASTKGILNIPYGDPVQIHLNGKIIEARKPFFMGLINQSYRFSGRGNYIKCFVIEFNDTGFYALFRENAAEFADSLIGAPEVITPRKMHQLSERLAETADHAQKIAIVEHFLLQFLPDDRLLYRIQKATAALQLIRLHRGIIGVESLADELCIGERQLRRILLEVKGCSPKNFAGLVRHTQVFTEVMQARAKPDWLSLAFKYSFYDQMHFIKDFRKYSLYNPTRFPREEFSVANSLSAPGSP